MASVRRKKICVVSGSRAEFGLLRPVLQQLTGHPRLAYHVLVSGNHLSADYGRTLREIEQAFPRLTKIRWRYDADTPAETARQIAECIRQAVPALDRIRPDLLLVLGDRSDILPVALAAGVLGIPVAQLHGGDVSGAFLDNAFRAAIAAFTSLHLPASWKGAKRLFARGIPRRSVSFVGAPGLDAIRKAPRMSPAGIRTALGLPQHRPYLIVLQHPVLGQKPLAGAQMRKTLDAVRSADLPALLLYPNADPGSRDVIREIERNRHLSRFVVRKNMKHDRFVNALRHAAALVGNSSSGIIEAPFLGTPVVNIGGRQDGRERGGQVTNVPHDPAAIRRALGRALRVRRRAGVFHTPYGNGRAAEKTVVAIERFLSKR